jgi:hypothetical protein
MATVGDVAIGLAQRLASITGLDMVDYVPDNLNAPAGFILLTDGREAAFGGGDIELQFDAVILTPRTSDRVNQRLLYDYASFSGDRSVFVAINTDPTLGGLPDTRARVVNVRNLHTDEIALYNYFGIAAHVEVTTPA